MSEAWLAPYLDRMEELSRRFFRHFHSRIDAAGGLSSSQFCVLKSLQAQGDLTVGELAQKMGMTTAGATGLLDRMVRANLVERHRDEADRRVVWVSLRPAGQQRLQEAGSMRRAIMAELFAHLTPDEAQQLVSLYEKLAQGLPAPAPELISEGERTE